MAMTRNGQYLNLCHKSSPKLAFEDVLKHIRLDFFRKPNQRPLRADLLRDQIGTRPSVRWAIDPGSQARRLHTTLTTLAAVLAAHGIAASISPRRSIGLLQGGCDDEWVGIALSHDFKRYSTLSGIYE
jgi:hypothetical protein